MVVVTAWLWCKSSAKKKKLYHLQVNGAKPIVIGTGEVVCSHDFQHCSGLWNISQHPELAHCEMRKLNQLLPELMEKKLRSIMRNMYMKHVWNLWTTTCTCIYIYRHIITCSCTSGLGDDVSPKIHHSERLPRLFSKEISQCRDGLSSGYRLPGFQAVHPFRKLAKCEGFKGSNRWSSLENE